MQRTNKDLSSRFVPNDRTPIYLSPVRELWSDFERSSRQESIQTIWKTQTHGSHRENRIAVCPVCVWRVTGRQFIKPMTTSDEGFTGDYLTKGIYHNLRKFLKVSPFGSFYLNGTFGSASFGTGSPGDGVLWGRGFTLIRKGSTRFHSHRWESNPGLGLLL